MYKLLAFFPLGKAVKFLFVFRLSDIPSPFILSLQGLKDWKAPISFFKSGGGVGVAGLPNSSPKAMWASCAVPWLRGRLCRMVPM